MSENNHSLKQIQLELRSQINQNNEFLEHIYELERENAKLREGAKLRDQSERESYEQETQTPPMKEPQAKTVVREVIKEVIREVPAASRGQPPSNVKESSEYIQLQGQMKT